MDRIKMTKNDDIPTAPRRRGGPVRVGVRVVAVAAIAALPILGLATTANAATPSNCDGMVCLYGADGSLVGTYHDVTGDWQYFDRVRTASAFNGFQNNAVYFLHATGQTSCEQPQRSASVDHPGFGPVVGVKIRPGGNCYPGGQIQ
jgi:hypothetical protein